jgi:hypothetical protein
LVAEGVKLLAKPFGRCAERVIRQMGVAFGRQRVGVTKQPADDL